MKSIKGTKTEKNLRAALQGESLARSKYAFFADKARTEGNEKVAELFELMIRNETQHAKIWYKLLYEIGSSDSNIMEAANGENDEWRSMYPSFAAEARAEGLDEVADLFDKVAAIEKNHEQTFLQALIRLQNTDKTKQAELQKEESGKPKYRCSFCGAVRDSRLDVCDLCQAIGAFEPYVEP